MKKILCIALACICAVSMLTGCVTTTNAPETVTPPTQETNPTPEQNETPENALPEVKLDEKTLNIYTALEDDIIADYLESFKSAYPDVTINITRDSTGIITAKLLAEKGNPQADVVWGTSAASLLVLEGQGMLKPYAPKGIETVLPSFKDSNNPPTWVGIDAWETAWLVNKDVLKAKGVDTVPETYQDLLDPKYQGLIQMPNPASSGTGLLTVNGILSLMGEEEGWKYLDKLNENIGMYVHSGSAPAKNAATGECGIGISFGYRCLKSNKDLADMGATVFPKEGSGWDVEANALMKKSEGEKEIAKKFLDWAIGDDVMAKYATNYPMTSKGVAADVAPAGYPKDPTTQLISKVDLKWCAENRERILDEWTKRYDGKSAPKQ